ncbi:hypothetical protein GGR37_001873 [Novosphingobium taihuense]|uniref:Uncharacterized protein n=1 Tax=Novosphingobium taihuense TaxID=260085 RepID=A0A7W7AAT2_9SPHN|nr:hypothetical protein [Novosphingobium taihuense]
MARDAVESEGFKAVVTQDFPACFKNSSRKTLRFFY